MNAKQNQRATNGAEQIDDHVLSDHGLVAAAAVRAALVVLVIAGLPIIAGLVYLNVNKNDSPQTVSLDQTDSPQTVAGGTLQTPHFGAAPATAAGTEH